MTALNLEGDDTLSTRPTTTSSKRIHSCLSFIDRIMQDREINKRHHLSHRTKNKTIIENKTMAPPRANSCIVSCR